jgi:hypothetical protein
VCMWFAHIGRWRDVGKNGVCIVCLCVRVRVRACVCMRARVCVCGSHNLGEMAGIIVPVCACAYTVSATLEASVNHSNSLKTNTAK